MKSWVCQILLLSLIAVTLDATAQNVTPLQAKKITAERLADMNVPRAGHAVLFTQNGELTVFGGHTTGFVPTQTAEWFDGTAWHTVSMSYIHDQGIMLPLSSGKVLLAGGHEQPLGIGQTFTVETYDPATHTFSGFGCLDHKRCFASAAEIDSGRVLISGTWYAEDGLELWDDSRTNKHARDVGQKRSAPYILRTGRDDAIVFGYLDEHGEKLARPALVERLHGEPYEEPFLKKWHPLTLLSDYRSNVSFVGDTSAEHYAYILPVQDDSGNVALALVDGGRFSLLSSDFAFPTQFEGRHITWSSRFVADRERKCGYVTGYDDDFRLYIVRADYAEALGTEGGMVKLSLLYSENPIEDWGPTSYPVLTPDGDILLAGGCPIDNFSPTAAVFRLPVGTGGKSDAGMQWHGFIAVAGVLLLAVALLIIYIRRRKRALQTSGEEGDACSRADLQGQDAEMFGRMQGFLLQENRFLSQSIRISDVASGLGMSDRELSTCLRLRGYRSFPDLLNAMRIDYACELLRQHPDMKVRVLCTEAGFSSESAFYSAFSSRMGTTPKQWVAEQNQSD